LHALGQPFQFLPATPIFIPIHFNFHSNSSHSNFLPCMLISCHRAQKATSTPISYL
jgi:hypothetical protein